MIQFVPKSIFLVYKLPFSVIWENVFLMLDVNLLLLTLNELISWCIMEGYAAVRRAENEFVIMLVTANVCMNKHMQPMKHLIY